MSGVHARLSASSAHRWLRCAGSVNASQGLSTTSVYAAAGTFAHDISAKCLADQTLSPSDFLLTKAVIDGHEVECDLEMVDAVRLYTDTVDEDLQEGDLGWIEMPLLDQLSKLDPDLGGTADYVRYRPSTCSLRVTDFKFGSGVYVEAVDNEQLKIYATGALLEVGRLGHRVDEVEVAIVQPRFEAAAPVRSFKFKAVDLLDFTADITEAAVKTRAPDAPYVAGEHCKFCPAAGKCPELEKKQRALMAAEFAVPSALAPARLSVALKDIPLLKERIKAIEEFAYAQALAGVEIPEFKLVDKRPVRRWKSDGNIIEWAQAQAIDPFVPREVLSPAQMEEKIKEKAPRGKKKAAIAVLEPFVDKISSGTALVPVDDDRPPVKARVTGADFKALPASVVPITI